MAGILATSLPVMAVLVLALSGKAAGNLRTSTERALVVQADRGSDIEEWLSERDEDLRALALLYQDGLGSREIGLVLSRMVAAGRDYDLIEIVDQTGRVLMSSDPTADFVPTGQPWFDQAVRGEAMTSSIFEQDGTLRFMMAHPASGPDGSTTGLVLADLRITAMLPFLSADFGRTARLIMANAQGQVLLSSSMVGATDDATLMAQGTLRDKLGIPLAKLRGSRGVGATESMVGGRSVSVGFQPGPRGLGWIVVTEEDASEVLALANSLRRAGIWLLLVGIGIQVGFAWPSRAKRCVGCAP